MLEIIKEAGTILKDLPDLAIWILVGILFYKIFIIGSSLAFAKYCVNKISLYLKNKTEASLKPKETISKVDINNRFICYDGTFNRFLSLLDKVHAHVKSDSKGKYLHHSDIEWMEKAIEKQILEDHKIIKK